VLLILSTFLFGASLRFTSSLAVVVVLVATYIYFLGGQTSKPPAQAKSGDYTQIAVKDTSESPSTPPRKSSTKRNTVFIIIGVVVVNIMSLTFISTFYHDFQPIVYPDLNIDTSSSADLDLYDGRILSATELSPKPAKEMALPVLNNSIGHCIVGGVRGFPDPKAYKSLRDNFINEFLPPEEKETVVLHNFFYMSLQDESIYSIREIEDGLSYVGPFETFIVSDIHDIPETGCTTNPNVFPKTGGPAFAFWAQSKKNHACLDRIREQEKIQGWRYDWIIRNRPDLVWASPSPVTIHTASRTKISLRKYPPGWLSVSDHWAVIPHQLADTYFSSHNAYFNCTTYEDIKQHCPGHPFGGDFYSECYLAKWLRDHHVEYDEYFIDWALIRSNGFYYNYTNIVGW